MQLQGWRRDEEIEAERRRLKEGRAWRCLCVRDARKSVGHLFPSRLLNSMSVNPLGEQRLLSSACCFSHLIQSVSSDSCFHLACGKDRGGVDPVQ
jgi:hypothetical protein